MRWMMLVCILPLVIFLFVWRSRSSEDGYLAPILIGGMVFAHLWMLFRGHGGHSDAHAEDKIGDPSAKQSETKDERNKRTHGGCCH